MKTIINLLIFGLLAILTVILPNNAFGQRDLSVITKGANVPYKNLSNECREYQLTINTGDVEGAEADASVFVTIKGDAGSTDRIEITGGKSLRRDNHNPKSDCQDMNTQTPATFVEWGSNNLVVEKPLSTIVNTLQRNSKEVLTIYTYNVGRVESVTLQHDNWYPNWFVSKLELSSGGETILNRQINRWFRSETLSQTFPVNENRNLTDYGIKVFTGDVYQAGTNSKVHLTLNGRKQVIPNIELGKIIPGNPFERNQTDETKIYDQPLVDGLPSITINLEKGARWFLGSITIESPNLFNPGVFRYNNWIEGGSPVTINAVEERLSPTRKITFRHEGFYMARMMIQYLENGPQGFPLPKFLFSADMPIGQNSVIEIPQDVKDPKIFLIGVGTVNNNFYASDFVGYLADDPCFKAWGSPASPQGGTCDGKPVSTTATNPITPSLYPKTVAEGEQSCFEMVQNVIADESNVKKLCKGTKDPYTTVACYGIRMPEVGSPNAIAECSGQIPFGSSPNIGTTTNRQTPPPPSIAQNEQDCFNQVQNKVAYDTAGKKVWNENNIKNLCRGTTNPPATIACFSSKMPQLGWSQASQECAASSQAQTRNKMPIPSSNQPTSSGLNLEGNWEMYNDKGVKFDKNAKISQSGSNLSINNGYGANSTAVLNGNSLKTSDGLSGTISPDGTKIDWDIKFVWVKQVSAPVTTANTGQVSPTTVGSSATLMPGQARDIDAKNGVVWIIGTDAINNEFGIYQLTGSSWTKVDGGARRIAVDNTGNPWVITSIGMIFRRENNSWKVIPGPNGATPLDIAISNGGEVWIVSDTGTVSRWTGSGWTNLIALSARKVIFTPNPDTFQIVDENGKRFVRESETSWVIRNDPSGLADKYIEFAVDLDGTKWGIDSSFNIWKLGGGK